MSASPETKPVFSREDTVMHPSEGVCEVQEIRKMRFGSLPEQMYYILKPSAKSGSSVVYLPVIRGNEILRRLLGPAEIDSLIRDSRDLPPLWITETKQQKRPAYIYSIVTLPNASFFDAVTPMLHLDK